MLVVTWIVTLRRRFWRTRKARRKTTPHRTQASWNRSSNFCQMWWMVEIGCIMSNGRLTSRLPWRFSHSSSPLLLPCSSKEWRMSSRLEAAASLSVVWCQVLWEHCLYQRPRHCTKYLSVDTEFSRVECIQSCSDIRDVTLDISWRTTVLKSTTMIELVIINAPSSDKEEPLVNCKHKENGRMVQFAFIENNHGKKERRWAAWAAGRVLVCNGRGHADNKHLRTNLHILFIRKVIMKKEEEEEEEEVLELRCTSSYDKANSCCTSHKASPPNYKLKWHNKRLQRKKIT